MCLRHNFKDFLVTSLLIFKIFCRTSMRKKTNPTFVGNILKYCGCKCIPTYAATGLANKINPRKCAKCVDQSKASENRRNDPLFGVASR